MTRDDRMMIRADAKAIGAVTALSGKASPRWKGTTRAQRSGDYSCYSILPDGTAIPFSRPRAQRDAIGVVPRKGNNSTLFRDYALHARIGATNGGNPDA